MKKPKTILHIIQSLDNGGCENMLLRTLPLLEREGLKNIVITLKQEGALAQKFRDQNITVENVHQKHLLDIASYYRILGLLKKHQAESVITYLLHADIAGRLFLQPFTKTEIIPFLRTTYNHPRYRIARIFERITSPFVKKYLANSQAVKDFYTHSLNVPKEKITVIPNGIDVEYFDSLPRDEQLRKSFGIRPEDTAIICVANLHINKGHTYLLEAFEQVFTKNKNIHLLIVGDGEEKENLTNQASRYSAKDNIHFLGQRNDVPKLLKSSDIFILPTLFEGMSNAIMEAMASGLPVITTDIPENKALIENGTSGILVPVKESSPITEAIEKLLDNKEYVEILGENAKEKIRDDFGLIGTAGKLKGFYDSCD